MSHMVTPILLLTIAPTVLGLMRMKKTTSFIKFNLHYQYLKILLLPYANRKYEIEHLTTIITRQNILSIAFPEHS